MNKFPTDDWLTIKDVKDSTEGYIILAQFYKKENVIIKLTARPSNELHIYRLLSKLPIVNPCLPKVYDMLSCFEKKENIKDKFAKLRGLCNGSETDVKVYMTIVEYIEGITLCEVKGMQFTAEQFFSLMIQGIYQIYNLYFVFGIMHNDFNESNILINKHDAPEIKFQLLSHPYRYYDFELGGDSCNTNYHSKYVKAYGVKLYLIDFDQASCYHKKYKNVKDITKHPIDSVREFIISLSKYADPKLWQVFEEHYESRGKHLIRYSQQFYDKYKEDPSDYNSYFLIDRTTVTLRMFCNELIYKYERDGLPQTYEFCR